MTDRHPMEELTDLIADVFAGLIERGEIDLEPGERDDEIEIQADEWTLAITGAPPSVAFLAIDDEPASAEEMPDAFDGVIEPDDLASMRELDRRLEGALRMALEQSGDLLSIELATLIAEEPNRR